MDNDQQIARTAAIEAAQILVFCLEEWDRHPSVQSSITFIRARTLVHQLTGDLEL